MSSVISENKINHLPNIREIGEEIPIDFVGPVLNEKKQQIIIIIAVDQFSKWTFAKVGDSCNTKNAIKLLAETAENIGLPKSIRVNNAKALKSQKFQKELLDKGIKLNFG